MQIVSNGDYLNEMSSPIFCDKYHKFSTAELVQRVINVKLLAPLKLKDSYFLCVIFAFRSKLLGNMRDVAFWGRLFTIHPKYIYTKSFLKVVVNFIIADQ